MELNINGKLVAIVAATAVACAGLGLAVSQAVSSPAPQHVAVHKVVAPAPEKATAPKPKETQAAPPQNQIIINNNPMATVPPAPPQAAVTADPWGVVQTYYGDIQSADYGDAWALLGSGATIGQTYGQFAAGFANSANQVVTENWESGDTVNVNVSALDTATGVVQYFTGSYTVDNGIITSASLTQTG